MLRDLSRRAARRPLYACLVLASVACAHTRPAPADWRDRLLSTARTTSFGSDTLPVRKDGGGDYPRDVPMMRFAQATSARGKVRVATRVTSDRDYPGLGISEGVNYVWVSEGKPTRIAVVPADPTKPAVWLKTYPHGRTAGDICQINPFASQLSIETSPTGGGHDDAPAGGPREAGERFATRATMCICVGGGWLHGGEAAATVDQRSAGALFPNG